VIVDIAFFFETDELAGEGGALDVEVFGQSFAVEGNGEGMIGAAVFVVFL